MDVPILPLEKKRVVGHDQRDLQGRGRLLQALAPLPCTLRIVDKLPIEMPPVGCGGQKLEEARKARGEEQVRPRLREHLCAGKTGIEVTLCDDLAQVSVSTAVSGQQDDVFLRILRIGELDPQDGLDPRLLACQVEWNQTAHPVGIRKGKCLKTEGNCLFYKVFNAADPGMKRKNRVAMKGHEAHSGSPPRVHTDYHILLKCIPVFPPCQGQKAPETRALHARVSSSTGIPHHIR